MFNADQTLDRREEFVAERSKEVPAFALIDASRIEHCELYLNAFGIERSCCLSGRAFDEYRDDAPWIARLDPSSSFGRWFLEDVVESRGGIVVFSRLGLMDLRRHLKKFLRIGDPEGKEWFFKFYRPEVMERYWPILTAVQRTRFFEGVDCAVTLSRDGNGYTLHDAKGSRPQGATENGNVPV